MLLAVRAERIFHFSASTRTEPPCSITGVQSSVALMPQSLFPLPLLALLSLPLLEDDEEFPLLALFLSLLPELAIPAITISRISPSEMIQRFFLYQGRCAFE